MSKELKGKIILGDQSPWVGGLTRLKSINAIGNVDVTYNVQDVDAPWAQNSIRDIQIKRGWPDYWSLANRHPFSLSIPGTRLGSAVQSLKSPEGLSYLVGPSTSQTIKSCSEDKTVGKNVSSMFLEEIEWAKKVSEVIGYTEGQERANQLKAEFGGDNNTLQDNFRIIKNLEGIDNDQVGSFYDYFSDDPAKLADVLPNKYYWRVEDRGYRHEHSRHQKPAKNEILIPKGPALPLEIAAKEHILAFTGLSYLDRVVNLRDEYTPNIKLKFLKVQFDWQIPQNPIDQLWDVFEEKKRARGQQVSKDADSLNNIKEYWHKRPTSISSHIFGGNLNPKLTYFEL